jgi:hypothetical protein
VTIKRRHKVILAVAAIVAIIIASPLDDLLLGGWIARRRK